MSQFDPNAILDAQLTEPTEKRPPLAEGEYAARIGEISSRTWTGKKDPSKSGVIWDVKLHIMTTPEQQASGYPPEVIITDGVMLNITPNGAIDNAPGKNPRLLAYREACDMNKPVDVFSARKMVGTMIRVKVKHELYEGSIFERIGLVSAF